jgi:hypothetical protein
LSDNLKFYAVRSRDGKWLRRKGIDGWGDSWVDELTKARIYNRPGPARAQISYWFSNYPSYGCPDLVVFTAGISEIINEEERLLKARAKQEKKAGIVRLTVAQRRLETAQEEVRRASRELEDIT